MKLLHIYTGNLFGGIETLLITLAQLRDLAPQIQSHFALCFEGRLAQELRTQQVDVTLLGEVRVRRPWTIWRARHQLEKLLKQNSFDAVICHACWSQAIFAPVVKINQIPLIFWCHDAIKGHHWLEKWAKKTIPNFILANSQYTQDSLKNIHPGVESYRLYLPVVEHPSSIDRANCKRIREELKVPEERVVIVQTSRLDRLKGHAVMLAALAQLKHLPHWECWIAGGVQRPQEAVYLQELQTQVQCLGLDNHVKFLGQRTDISCVLAAADIHCQANIGAEAFGIAFIEALYAGLPVVTTEIGGALEIVDASCGKLVPPNDSDALSQALALLITNSAERQRLAANSQQRAHSLCNPKRQLTQLQTILAQGLSHRSLILGKP